MITAEFVQQQAIYLFRIVLACVCGGIIGLERQQRTKVAGTRTHMMIALATALMMLISKYGFMDVVEIPGAGLDVSRVAAGIISGRESREMPAGSLRRWESGRRSESAWRWGQACIRLESEPL